jgi:hypothetical protein
MMHTSIILVTLPFYILLCIITFIAVPSLALRNRLYDRIESYPWYIVLDFYNYGYDAIDAILLHHRQGQILVSRPVTLSLVKAPPIVTVFPEILTSMPLNVWSRTYY